MKTNKRLFIYLFIYLFIKKQNTLLCPFAFGHLTYGPANISCKELVTIHPLHVGQVHQVTEVQLRQLKHNSCYRYLLLSAHSTWVSSTRLLKFGCVS